MGANGSKASGALETDEGKTYETVLEISENIKVLEPRNKNLNIKLPEESHTPNRVYVVINKPVSGEKGKNDPYAGKLKSIGVYGPDCKKLYEIHVDHVHDGLQIHYHPWENGHPVRKGTGKNSPNVAYELNSEMKNLLETIKKQVPYA